MNSRAGADIYSGLEFEIQFDAVSVRSGLDPKLRIAQRTGEPRFLVFSYENDEYINCHIFIMRDFSDGKAAAAWFKRHAELPPSVLHALRANDLRPLIDVSPRRPMIARWAERLAMLFKRDRASVIPEELMHPYFIIRS